MADDFEREQRYETFGFEKYAHWIGSKCCDKFTALFAMVILVNGLAICSLAVDRAIS